MGDTGVDGGSGVVIVGIGVGDGDGTQPLGLGDKFRRAGQFGRDIHDADKTAAALVQLLEALKIRVLQVVGVLCAALLVGEVGPLHLDAHETGQSLGGFGVELLRGGEGFFQHVVGQGHGGGGKGGHAALGIESGKARDIAIISRVNKPVCFRIIGFETGGDGRPAAICSRRAVQQECVENYLDRLVPGDVIPAVVTHMENFGCFADIGCGISSLLPIDGISVSRIGHPSDRFRGG